MWDCPQPCEPAVAAASQRRCDQEGAQMRAQGAYSLTIEIANISPNIEFLFRDLHPTLHSQARKTAT
jgi:hypothetical protein